MHKILSVLSLGFIISSVRAEGTYPLPSTTSQATQVANDTPQNSYVPAASTYQNSDTISVCVMQLQFSG